LKEKVEKPKEFTDAQAEAFTRYLTKIPKAKKKSLVEAVLETDFGKTLIEKYVKEKKSVLEAVLKTLKWRRTR